MTDYFHTRNAIVLSFMPYSGGKFLSNCLALSRHVCPQDSSAADYLLSRPDDYDRRLEIVLRTLPSPDQMLDWRLFEYGDMQLYGDACVSWKLGIAAEPNDITKKLCVSDMRFFIVDQSMVPISLCQVWKNATIVRLINYDMFQAVCLVKKTGIKPTDMTQINGNYCVEKYNILRGQSWPSWQQFESCGYDITKCDISDQELIDEIGEFYNLHTISNQTIIYDVDNSYFNKDVFLMSVKNLYTDLGLPDFSYDLVECFYSKYISLHV